MKVIKYIIRRLTIILLFILAHILYPHRVYGRKNIPKGIPYLIYSNHISMIDPVFIVTTFFFRNTHFMGKEELFKNPVLSWYFRAIGGFPVKRGSADMTAIRQCVNIIKQGEVMVIFPEGTRNQGDFNELQTFHNGASLVLYNSKVPAVPVYLENKKGMRMFSFTKVHIGKPIDMSEFTDKRLSSDNLSASTAKLKAEMQKMMEKAKKI